MKDKKVEIDFIGTTAFDAIYEANVDMVYYTAMRYIRNEHTAEEIAQNVFLKLYTCMSHIEPAAVRSWLRVTTKNMALNHIRKEKQEILFAEMHEEVAKVKTGRSPEDEFIQRTSEKECEEFAHSLFEELYKTNERWYDAVTMTYCLKKPQKEVAEVMGVSIEVLHSMLYRAKKWIQKNYEDSFACLYNA